MKSCYTLFLFLLIIPASLFGKDQDTTEQYNPKRPMALSLRVESGYVFPTNDFVRKEDIPKYSSLSFKYALRPQRDQWEDIAYGMPYLGVGLYTATFYKKDLGIPFSIFLFQGATITEFVPGSITFHYEFNLGYSANWKAYDRFDNPNNIAVGSSENIHVGGGLYLKFLVNRKWDINIGLAVTHFSNGATKMPNKGLNLGTPYVELTYKFNDPDPEKTKVEGNLIPPQIEKRIDHDFLLTFSSRQIYHSTVGTGLTSQFVDHKFKVWGFSYAPLVINNYKYKWGPSIELVYDESAGATAWREQHPEDLHFYDRIKLGKVEERFSLGISAKGEIVMPRFSFFANVGYDIFLGNESNSRFYQIVGVKVYLNDRIFGTFGIRATHFSKAQFIFWSGGYTLKGKPFKKRND
jgi:hypothetical protein